MCRHALEFLRRFNCHSVNLLIVNRLRIHTCNYATLLCYMYAYSRCFALMRPKPSLLPDRSATCTAGTMWQPAQWRCMSRLQHQGGTTHWRDAWDATLPAALGLARFSASLSSWRSGGGASCAGGRQIHRLIQLWTGHAMSGRCRMGCLDCRREGESRVREGLMGDLPVQSGVCEGVERYACGGKRYARVDSCLTNHAYYVHVPAAETKL